MSTSDYVATARRLHREMMTHGADRRWFLRGKVAEMMAIARAMASL